MNAPASTRRLSTLPLAGALLLLLAHILSATPARADDTQPKAPDRSHAALVHLFQEGNRLFKEALDKGKKDPAAAANLFRDAAAAWRTISLEGGVHNAKLECNIANASLLAGDAPRAIAAFRRAQAIEPRNPAVASGLAAARRAAGTESLAPGAISATTVQDAAGGFSGTIRVITSATARGAIRALDYLPERPLLWLAAISYLGAFVLASVRVSGAARARWWPVPALLALAALSAAPLIARDTDPRSDAVVIATGAVARDGPAELYDPAFKEPLTPGLEVQIEERRPGWLRIRLADGRAAWVPEASVEVL